MSAHRQQILLSGSASECRQRALQLLDGRRALWVSNNAPAAVEALPIARAATRLGEEVVWLVFDAHDGFSPDAFGAVTGMIRGGGGLLLLMPAEEPCAPEARFLARLYRCIGRDKHWQLNPQRLLADAASSSPETYVPTIDQQRAVDAVCRVARGHRRRPAVLIADRGRGKSSALGIAAAQLIGEGNRKILVTAPRRDAVAALFDHAARNVDGGQVPDSLRYIAMDALLADAPEADLLLVDEAAGFPVALLEQVLQRYSRVVFATTVHGYEGAGQGFSVRFQRLLDAHCGQWRQVNLQAPVRWADGDPLEQFVFDALLLDAEPAAIAVDDLTGLRISRLDRDLLQQDEQQLRALFGLLVSAHYRTTPRDLLELLDNPDMGVFVAQLDGQVVAVLLYANEGGLEADLARDISAGLRRVKGHLVPQVLAAQLGFAEAAQLQVLRVVRLAVHASLRRRGIAGQLLAALHTYAGEQHIDMLGVSYGATPELLHFWQQSGYRSVRLGMQREASSGAHAVLMLHSLSTIAIDLQAAMMQRFGNNWLPQLADALRQLPPAVVIALGSKTGGDATDLVPDTVRQLTAFAQGGRGYDDALWALQQWLLATLQSEQQLVDAPTLEALVQKILQGRSWSVVAERLQLPGRAAVLDRFRTAVGQLS